MGANVTAKSLGYTYVQLEASNSIEPFKFQLLALVLDKLTSLLPSKSLTNYQCSHTKNLQLADPKFHISSSIDCILGADVFSQIMISGVKIGPPIAQKTKLGWILTEPVTDEAPVSISVDSANNLDSLIYHSKEEDNISKLLAKFWEIESISLEKLLPQEEIECNQFFEQTVSRTSEGRYVVSLPFKSTPSFPGSRNIALSCLFRLEKRFLKDTNLKNSYDEFMKYILNNKNW